MVRVANVMVMICLFLLAGAFLFAPCSSIASAANEGTLIPSRDNQTKKWGYVNSVGEQAIPPQFDNAHPFSDGLAKIEHAGKIGFIDEGGHIVIAPLFDRAESFREGRAAVSPISGRCWLGYIDGQGQCVVKPQFRSANHFNDGLALVETSARDLMFIDRHGRVAISTGDTFSINYQSVFSEGLAVARDNSLGLVGYIDTNGVFAIPPRFRFAQRFGEGLAAVCPARPEDNAKWGYINTNGQWVIQPQFDLVHPFFEGCAEVTFGTATQDRTYALINRHGNFITDRQAIHPPFPNEPATFAPHSYDESPTVRIATFGNNSINEAWSKLCAYVEKEYGIVQPQDPDSPIVESFWNYQTTGVPRSDYRVRLQLLVFRAKRSLEVDVIAEYFRGHDRLVGTDLSVKRKLEKEFGTLVRSNDRASSKAAVSSSPDRMNKSPAVDTARPARSMQDKVASITIATVKFIDANMRDVVEFLDGYAKQKGAHITLNVDSPSAVPGISYEGRFVTLLEAIRGVTDAAGLRYRITDDSVVIESAAEPVRDKPIGVIQKAPKE